MFDENDLPPTDPINSDNFGIGCGCLAAAIAYTGAVSLLYWLWRLVSAN